MEVLINTTSNAPGVDQVNMDYNRIVTKLCLSWAENYICFSHKDDLGIGYM